MYLNILLCTLWMSELRKQQARNERPGLAFIFNNNFESLEFLRFKNRSSNTADVEQLKEDFKRRNMAVRSLIDGTLYDTKNVMRERNRPTQMTERQKTQDKNERPGYVLIINNINFETLENKELKLKNRTSSTRDVERLKKHFKCRNMVVENLIDGTVNDIKRRMREISRMNFKRFRCLVVVIMSHGTVAGTIYARDRQYSIYRDIWPPILRNKTLKMKPKVLIVEACKGSLNPIRCSSKKINESPKLKELTFIDDIKKTKPFKWKMKNMSNMIHLDSCQEGFVSYVDPIDGAVFVDVLCKRLKEYGRQKNIEEIFNYVVNGVKDKLNEAHQPRIQTNLKSSFVL